MVWLLARKAGGLPREELAGSLVRTVIASVAMGLALWSYTYFLAGAGAWVLGLGGLVVGSGVFLLAALLLGSPEPAGLLRAVRRRRG